MMTYCFIGLDIGRYEIDAFVLSANRKKISTFQFSQTHCGYKQLIEKIHHLEKEGLTPIISAEGHDGNLAPLDEYLLNEGVIFKIEGCI